MKRRLTMSGRKLALLGALVPLAALFVYVAMRSGPLAPVSVTVAVVESKAITPALSGVGTIEPRYTYRIGPIAAGRVKSVKVEIGDRVRAGQLLGEMDPVDLDERIVAQEAALKRAEANVLAVEAQLQDVSARKAYAEAQKSRYEELLLINSASAEVVEAKRQELKVTDASLRAVTANLSAARHDLARALAERRGLLLQREALRLVSPVDGLVTGRGADPGATVVAGQFVVEVIDTANLEINARFDQLRSSGLRAGLKAGIVLRSQEGKSVDGRVSRVEPRADAVTEETLIRVKFDSIPEPPPPVGELVEVTVGLPSLPPQTVAPGASVRRVGGRLGVWVVENGSLRFAPVKLGATDLNGLVQIVEGVKPGERVVVYSQRALEATSRIKVVERLPGVAS